MVDEQRSWNLRPPPASFGLPASLDSQPQSGRGQPVDEASTASADSTDDPRQALKAAEPDEAQ
jgi:hypothetical protein